MSTSTTNVMVTTDHSVPVEPLGGTATVKVNSGDTVYYNDNPAVDATHNIASIVAGGSADLTVASWLKSAGTSSVTITRADAAAVATAANAVKGSQAAPGNLGATYTIDFASVANTLVEVKGVLNANCTITLANRAAGCQAILLLSQDGTGGRSLSVSDGVTPTAVTIPAGANASTIVEVICPDATDLFAAPIGVPGPTGPQGIAGPTGPQGQALAQSDYDAIMPWTVPVHPLAAVADAAVKVGTWATILQPTTSPTTGSGPAVFNTPAVQNDSLGWDLALSAGTWTVGLVFVKGSTQGIYTVAIDGTTVGTIDAYNASTTYGNAGTITGISVATNAKHRLTVTMATKNASSTGFGAIFFALQVRRTA